MKGDVSNPLPCPTAFLSAPALCQGSSEARASVFMLGTILVLNRHLRQGTEPAQQGILAVLFVGGRPPKNTLRCDKSFFRKRGTMSNPHSPVDSSKTVGSTASGGGHTPLQQCKPVTGSNYPASCYTAGTCDYQGGGGSRRAYQIAGPALDQTRRPETF